VRQDVADVNLLPIVVDSGNYPGFISADIKDGAVQDSAGVWKYRPDLLDIGQIPFSISVYQWLKLALDSGDFSKVVNRFTGNNAHLFDSVAPVTTAP
jgi:hypothetical protein